MANPEHLARLQRSVKEWNQWREENLDDFRPDLSEADLRGANLRMVNLTLANLNGANLRGANLGYHEERRGNER